MVSLLVRSSGIALLVLLIALAGCSPSSRTPVRSEGRGGELRVIAPGEPESLNPDLGRDEIAVLIGENLFDKLVSLDADSRVIPDLARSWSLSQDGRSYTFHLLPGVLWHDGKPLTADDVRWTFESLAREEGPARSTLSRIEGIATPDPRTRAICGVP